MILEKLQNASVYLYSLYGGVTGTFYAFMLDSWEQITLALVLGFVGSLGGILAKVLINFLFGEKIKKN